ncbi:MAG: DUF6456 domain-containing protein [Pseudomonadota bacterium]
MTQIKVGDFALPALMPLPSRLVPVMQALRERDTYLAVNKGLPKAVIVRREGAKAEHKLSVERIHVRDLTDMGYIEPVRKGTITLYRATQSGATMTPAELKENITFQKAGEIDVLKESPVRNLARKKGPDGKPFLGPDHLKAADILSEDFRMAGFEDHPVGSLVELVDYCYAKSTAEPILNAHSRIVTALMDLGPDLGDIALRCCCMGEGLETAERRMGWSARSGKVVLRIALRRLVVHYEKTGGDYCWVR